MGMWNCVFLLWRPNYKHHTALFCSDDGNSNSDNNNVTVTKSTVDMIRNSNNNNNNNNKPMSVCHSVQTTNVKIDLSQYTMIHMHFQPGQEEHQYKGLRPPTSSDLNCDTIIYTSLVRIPSSSSHRATLIYGTGVVSTAASN
eukprot:jgi/Psemu1/8688/gm1.8688_g